MNEYRSTAAPGGPATLFTIPPGVPFLDALARGVIDNVGTDPLALTTAQIFLPTKRACRNLQDAFFRVSEGSAVLLPRLQALGDLEADELSLLDQDLNGSDADAQIPPAMPVLTRQMLMTRLVLKWAYGRGELSLGHAARLAEELARLMDQVAAEGLDLKGLEELVPDTFAEHWQATLQLLRILTEAWPAIEADYGVIGVAERRRRLLQKQARAWREQATSEVTIVAGSTGSLPATAELMSAVARLAQGMVVLPGLDREASDDLWEAIGEDPCHPQYGMARLLERLGVDRSDVADWPMSVPSKTIAARTRLFHFALRPAKVSQTWRHEAHDYVHQAGQALSGIERIDCASSAEEAQVIALVLRQALAVPGQTAALVTPDRDLARRVACALKRWEITVDDSAGMPLALTPPGTFLLLAAKMVVEQFAPLSLLAALKHPLAAGGAATVVMRMRVRELERSVLRGPRPAPGIAGLRVALESRGDRYGLLPWLAALERSLSPAIRVFDQATADLSELIDAHIGLAEGLASSAEESGDHRLWSGAAGEATAQLFAELRNAGITSLSLDAASYLQLVEILLQSMALRPPHNRHPRIAILGPLEARLQHADVMVLGGLNEGSWPSETDTGPWLSRPMRRQLGLPDPERKIGLGAHDFLHLTAQPRVILTRATRVAGTPSVPSRWLLRLDAVLRAAGLDGERLLASQQPWLRWAGLLDNPQRIVPCDQPAPRPPVSVRPRRLSVTKIETWMRDPYGLYASEILKLKALEPIDADPDAATQGTLIHRALEAFTRRYPDQLPIEAERELIRIGEEVFAEVRDRPGIHAIWWPRFLRIAEWFIGEDRKRRQAKARPLGEVRGSHKLANGFVLYAKADRIDIRRDGSLVVLDYKTGQVPKEPDIHAGLAPQLPLEAAIAEQGGFQGVPSNAVQALEFWQLTGRMPAGIVTSLSKYTPETAALALAGLTQLVTAFDDPETPYVAINHLRERPRFNDFEHLERLHEWAGDLEEEQR